MAIEYITFPNKSRGDVWSSGNVNEVKEVVNANADVLRAHASRLDAAEGAISGIDRAVEQTSGSAQIAPNVLNKWPSPAESLTLTFAAGRPGHTNEYRLEFTVSGNSFTLTLPSGVRWAEEPEWEDGYTYQVSIEDGLAVGAGWRPASS